jgi:acyl-CoA synthetase (AMP-forming)/AMP-acid ligase II
MQDYYLVHHILGVSPDEHERIALIDNDRSMTYIELCRGVERCAAHLRMARIVRGDRVVILLPKGLEECLAIFGVSRADGVFVPVNSLLRPSQIRHIVEDCGARFLITNRLLLSGLGDDLRSINNVVTIIVVDAPAEEAVDVPNIFWDNGIVEAPPNVAIGEDLAAILYTSGSTGNPKGVMLSHRNLLAGSRIVRTYLEITQTDRILSILPFSFDYGLNQLLTAVEQRATVVLLTFQFGDDVVHALSEHRITGLAGVPTLWTILIRAAPSLLKTRLPYLRYITNSGGAVPSEMVRQLRELLPNTRIFLMYGLTEAFRSTYLPPEEIDRRPTSIGKAIPECEVFAVTADGQRL